MIDDTISMWLAIFDLSFLELPDEFIFFIDLLKQKRCLVFTLAEIPGSGLYVSEFRCSIVPAFNFACLQVCICSLVEPVGNNLFTDSALLKG